MSTPTNNNTNNNTSNADLPAKLYQECVTLVCVLVEQSQGMPTIADGLGARRTAIRALERAYVSPQFPPDPRADYPATTAPTEHIPRRSPSLRRGLPAIHA